MTFSPRNKRDILSAAAQEVYIMLIKDFQVGMLQTNCYIVTDESTLETAVIDPGAEAAVILNYVEANKLKVKYVFLTHGHG
ncbi:MAG: MBL fold metallo-hydrolase, partial [Oscillospiraceae bacterium]|nr:MBL fold metallo-hydrolase [Oscillospiraceae bacterium]